MADNGELRIGVIGAGGRGHLARAAHRPEQGVRLVAGCDVVDATLADFQERFGPDAFVTRDYRELVARDDLDAVFVTSPDFLHEEHAVAAIEAGKDIYLEKPMTITVEGCDRVLRTAFEHQRKIYMGFNMRFSAYVRKMKRLIEQGAIGQPKAAWCRHFVGYGGDAFFKDWHAERAKSTGMLLQKASHDIDVMHWLCNGYTVRTNAMGALTLYDQIEDRHPPEERGDKSWHMEHWPPLSQKGLNPVIDIEDLTMMNMQLDNGVLATYMQCHYAPDQWRNYTVIGTEGRIENFGNRPGAMVVRLWNRRTDYNPYGDEQFFIPQATGGHGGADPGIVDEFLRYVREGGKITTSAVAGRNSVAAGYMATQSLRDGGTPRDIPPVDPEVAAYFEADVRPTLTD